MTDEKTFHDKVQDAREDGVCMLAPDEARQLIEQGGVTVIDVDGWPCFWPQLDRSRR
jgi:hypothetical protein